VQVHGQNGGTAVRLVRMLLELTLLLLLLQVVVVMGKVMIVNQIGGIGVQIV
jgi:hypothetical protein